MLLLPGWRGSHRKVQRTMDIRRCRQARSEPCVRALNAATLVE